MKIILLGLFVIFHIVAIGQRKPILYDAHGHISLYSGNALDSLAKYGVYGVRDCGGDFKKLLQLRSETKSEKKHLPKIILCGPFLDGPKNSPLRGSMTITITNKAEAIAAIDSLSRLKVDFIKAHNVLSPESYFTILEEAKKRKIKVVSHLPRGIPVWEAVSHGATCIEHIAESILASPIYAGYVKTPEEAGIWWLTSPKADSIILEMSKHRIFLTPTLIAYKTLCDITTDPKIKEQLDSGFNTLLKITMKFHKQGITILAGSDFYSDSKLGINIIPGKSLLQEINLLKQAGLSKKEAVNAASKNILKWLKS